MKKGQSLRFSLTTSETIQPYYSLEAPNEPGIGFDTLGNFSWTPRFDWVDRLEKQKEKTIFFEAKWVDGRKIRKGLNFIISHQNRPPTIEELPTLYVKQSTLNQYQISPDYINDSDGDPIVFKPKLCIRNTKFGINSFI